MKQAIEVVRRLVDEEEGVTMVEYGLIAALISVVALVALGHIGTNINIAYKAICNALAGAVTGGTACP